MQETNSKATHEQVKVSILTAKAGNKDRLYSDCFLESLNPKLAILWRMVVSWGDFRDMKWTEKKSHGDTEYLFFIEQSGIHSPSLFHALHLAGYQTQ